MVEVKTETRIQEYFVVRYRKTAPLSPRPHAPTEGIFFEWSDANTHLLAQFNAGDLEVQRREREIEVPVTDG